MMTTMTNDARAHLPRASAADTLAVAAEVVAPTLAKGLLIRRPGMVGLAQSLNLDDRGVRRMQKLRRTYGDGPLMLAVPVRRQALILDPDDANRVLGLAPHPFAPASTEKRAALAHFEPKVALASRGEDRADRRRFNERVLEPGRVVHPIAERMRTIVAEEAAPLMMRAQEDGTLVWDAFFATWYRIVRRLVLGDGARDDEALTNMLSALRKRANWAFLAPRNAALRERFHGRLGAHLDRAESGSLAARIAATPKSDLTEPTHQVAQWLFAFDPGCMATFRALALLAVHPEQMEHARSEIGNAPLARGPHYPFLRATLLESLRLWPTTPAILRETLEDVPFANGLMPKGTNIVIYAPYFHRDEERLDFAHRFAPEIWLEGRVGDWPLVPFSKGPAACPAKDFVPLVAATMMAAVLAGGELRLKRPHMMGSTERLSGTLDNYSMVFSVALR